MSLAACGNQAAGRLAGDSRRPLRTARQPHRLLEGRGPMGMVTTFAVRTACVFECECPHLAVLGVPASVGSEEDWTAM